MNPNEGLSDKEYDEYQAIAARFDGRAAQGRGGELRKTESLVEIAEQPVYLNHTGEETVFGERWNGGTIRLNAEHLEALKAGKTLLLDVQAEYLLNLQLENNILNDAG